MEIFRELEIRIDPEQMDAIADSIENNPPSGWGRDRAAEGQVHLAHMAKPTPTYCFRCSQEGGRPSAALFVRQRDSAEFVVANIVPLDKEQLTYREYNTVLEDFYERVLQPFVGQQGVTAELSNSQVDLEHWMSHETAEFLREFSTCANKWTGSSRPSDKERWNSFVIAAHHEKSHMDAPSLQRWLVEVGGWPLEVADQLAAEYEYGRELLADAEGSRWSA